MQEPTKTNRGRSLRRTLKLELLRGVLIASVLTTLGLITEREPVRVIPPAPVDATSFRTLPTASIDEVPFRFGPPFEFFPTPDPGPGPGLGQRRLKSAGRLHWHTSFSRDRLLPATVFQGAGPAARAPCP